MKKTAFASYCWGAAGSHWLARLLGSHPDIFCSHVPYRPPRHVGHLEQLLETFRWMGEQKAWPCYGVTHGVSGLDHEDIAQWCASCDVAYRAFVVTRHPIPRILSGMALDRELNSYPLSWWNATVTGALELSVELGAADLRVNLDLSNDEDRSFFRYAYLCRTIDWETRLGVPIFCIEHIRDKERQVFELLLGEGCYIPDTTYISQKRVAVHAGTTRSPKEIWGTWPEKWKGIYRMFVSDDIARMYEAQGYGDVLP